MRPFCKRFSSCVSYTELRYFDRKCLQNTRGSHSATAYNRGDTVMLAELCFSTYWVLWNITVGLFRCSWYHFLNCYWKKAVNINTVMITESQNRPKIKNFQNTEQCDFFIFACETGIDCSWHVVFQSVIILLQNEQITYQFLNTYASFKKLRTFM